MEFDKHTELFIKDVCLRVRDVRAYEELDEMLTDLVDEYGRRHLLTEEEMDNIQNEIYKRLDL